MAEAGDASAPHLPPAAVRLFLLARFSAQTAALSQAVAVGWYVYARTGSALALGFIGLVQFLATAGLALIAGHVVDRFPRRRVLLAALGCQTVCSAALATLTATGSPPVAWVFLVIFCVGAARAFHQPALTSLLPGLVPRPQLARAIAWSSLAAQIAVILGPTVGGLLYVVGPSAPFIAAAALLAIAWLAILALPAPAVTGPGAPLSWQGLMRGVSFIWQNEALRGAISLDLFAVLFGGATALLPIFARDILAIGPVGLGLLRSAPALGGLLSGAVLARRPPQRRIGRHLLIAVAAYGAATLVFGLSRSAPLSFLALTAVGAADVNSVVIRSTLLQIAAPDAIRGRVNAVNSMFLGAFNQLGEFESGVTAAWFGPVGSVVLGGVATLFVAALWARAFPVLRRADRFAEAEGDVRRFVSGR